MFFSKILAFAICYFDIVIFSIVRANAKVTYCTWLTFNLFVFQICSTNFFLTNFNDSSSVRGQGFLSLNVVAWRPTVEKEAKGNLTVVGGLIQLTLIYLRKRVWRPAGVNFINILNSEHILLCQNYSSKDRFCTQKFGKCYEQ